MILIFFKFKTDDFACIGTIDVWKNIPLIELHFTDRDFIPSKYIFSNPKQLRQLSHFLLQTADEVERIHRGEK